VQVLHEETAPQHREGHRTHPQGLLHRVVRDEPGPVGPEHRHVDDVAASRVLSGPQNGMIAVRAARLLGNGNSRNTTFTPARGAFQRRRVLRGGGQDASRCGRCSSKVPTSTVGPTYAFVVRVMVMVAASSPTERRRVHRARLINAFGAFLTGVVLVVVMITKFTHGAYLVVIAIPVLCVLMAGIHRHYLAAKAELRVEPDDDAALPSRVHAIVLVSSWHKATQRALLFARATKPDTLTALTVNIDDADTRALLAEWATLNVSVPLKVIESPYREITRPVVGYIKQVLRTGSRDVVNVYIPEYVVGHWWENVLHNQSSLRLKGRLLFEPGVMVTSVPWQLRSTARRDLTRVDHSPGDVRSGITRSQSEGLAADRNGHNVKVAPHND
jgi:hypothetical protein